MTGTVTNPIVVGQKLWRQPHERTERGDEFTVVKLGYKWVSARCGGRTLRFDMDTMEEECLGQGHSVPAVYWLSEESAKQSLSLDAAWALLRERFAKERPKGIGLEQMIAVYRALGEPTPDS